jgi:hypothetical protein
MDTRVFIGGSMNIKHLDSRVKVRIDKILAQDFEIVVGDANGVDKSIQTYLFDHGVQKTKVFCSGDRPRNNVGNWPVERVLTGEPEGSRAFFTAKDVRMAEIADFGLMIWDTTSTGTLSNVLELLVRKKKSVVFVNKSGIFKNISNIEEFEGLLSFMSPHAKQKANEKIRLLDKIDALRHEQLQMFA